MVLSTAVMENVFTEKFNEITREDETTQLSETRIAALAHFAAVGFPTQHDEDWKYTNAAKTAAATDWAIASHPSDLKDDPAFAGLLSQFDAKQDGFSALHLAFADIICIKIEPETVVEDPIELNFAAESGSAIFPHILIIAGAGSKATIIENYQGSGFTNAATQVVVEDNANITHYRIQRDTTDALHIANSSATLGRGSSYNSTNINLGAAMFRHGVNVKFTAEGAEAWVDGLYMLGGEQHSDTHSVIDHAVPNCLSHQTYKGVLNDKSRGVFNGKVFVRLNASGTDAQQSNKNLLLSNDARVDTKPQLEIFNDDVKCSHGATVGQLEEEELFYLLTRGLPKTLAKNLLTYGFAEEIINKIKIEEIKSDLDGIVLNRLGTEI